MVEGIYDQIKDTVKMFVYMSDNRGLPPSKIENLYEYEALIEAESDEFDWPHLHEDTYATLCYTTATTGLPKGAMFTHRALYLQTIHLMALSAINNDPSAVFLGENIVPMMTTPLFHIHAWCQPFAYVFSAAKIVLPGISHHDTVLEFHRLGAAYKKEHPEKQCLQRQKHSETQN